MWALLFHPKSECVSRSVFSAAVDGFYPEVWICGDGGESCCFVEDV